MRITTLMIQQKRQSHLLDSQTRLEKARDKVSTGVRLARPSDDPGATAELLRIKARLAEAEQRRVGIETNLPAMRASESALGEISAALQTARQAGLKALNTATVTPEQRVPLASQVENALRVVLAQVNTRIDDRYVFAGTANETPPFVAGPPVTYVGNNTPLAVGVAEGTPLTTSVTGQTLRNPRAGVDLFENLTDLAEAIRAGDNASLSRSMDRLEEDWSHVVTLRGDMGARTAYVEQTRDRLEEDLLTLQARQSDLRDTDLAEAAIEARTAETVQEATLAVVGRLGSPTLLDYLR